MKPPLSSPDQINDQESASSPDLAWEKFRRAERRGWWMWSTAMVVTLLLTAGMLSFIAAELAGKQQEISWVEIPEAVRGLIAVVLLFNIYAAYQQLQLLRTRRQLFQQEEIFRMVRDNATDMIAMVDMAGKRLYNSLSYQRVVGYSPEELLATYPEEQIHPDDYRAVRAAAEEARRTGVGQTVEYRFRHKDGGWRTFESTARVIPNRQGRPEKLVIVNRDVSERRARLEALELADAGFRSVIEDAPYGIFTTNREGQLLRVNPALQKMLGYESTEELLAANLATAIFKSVEDFRSLVEVSSRGEGFKDVDVDWQKKDGTPITVRCSGRGFASLGERPASFEMFVEDITEKRILERQLRMAGKMEAVGRLSGGIAHDFNNLLGVIIGYSQVLKRALGPANPLTEHALEIEKAGDRAAALTRQLLAFSRQQILTPTVMNLNDLVADMQKMLPRLIGEDITVTIAPEPELKSVRADRNQIEQVIMNMAVNARDAMPEGGSLEIATKNVRLDEPYTRLHPGARVGNYVCLVVTDTGTGMNPETLAHIFEPFFTTKEMGKGTGLGLATVYGIVKQSGGYLWVDSEVGRGSSFQVYLPRIEEVAAAASVEEAPTENVRGSETILLVEDAEALRNLAASFLTSHGFNVLTAQDAEHALRTAASYHSGIHMLLTDVIMPGMNGRVLADRLVRLEAGLKVLYMSGYTDSFIAGHGVLGPECHLINKPFTEESLLRKVRDVLDGKASLGGEPVLAGAGMSKTRGGEAGGGGGQDIGGR